MIIGLLVTIAIFAIVLWGSWLALRFMFSELAKQRKFVTFRKDGEIQAVVRGEDGDCAGFVMSVANHRIDPDGWDIFKGSDDSYAGHLLNMLPVKQEEDPGFSEHKLITDRDGAILLFGENGSIVERIETNTPLQRDPDGNILVKDGDVFRRVNGKPRLNPGLARRIERANRISLFEQVFKVTWVGFVPYQIFGYQFRWIKYGQAKAVDGKPSNDIGMHARDEEVFTLFFRYTQYGLVVTAETGAGSIKTATEQTNVSVPESIQVTVSLVIETMTVNPKKTLFRTAGVSAAGEWLSAITRDIADKVRTMLANNDVSWDTIISKGDAVTGRLESIRLAVNGESKDGVLIPKTGGAVRDYGQRVVKIRLVNADLTDQRLQEAINNVFAAKRQRDERFILAEAQQREAAVPLLGKAQGLQAIANIPGGKEMFVAEQYGSGGIKVLTVSSGGTNPMGPMIQLPGSILDDEGPDTGDEAAQSPPSPPPTPEGVPTPVPQPTQERRRWRKRRR